MRSVASWAVGGLLVGAMALPACQVSLPVRGPTEEVFMGADSATLSSMTNLPWDTSFEIITKNRNHIKGKRSGSEWTITVNRNPAKASYAANLIRNIEFNEGQSTDTKKGTASTKAQILDWLEGS